MPDSRDGPAASAGSWDPWGSGGTACRELGRSVAVGGYPLSPRGASLVISSA